MKFKVLLILVALTIFGSSLPAFSQTSSSVNSILVVQNNANDFYRRGLQQYSDGNYIGAIQSANQALRLSNNRFAEVYVLRGLARNQLGQVNEAIGDYIEAIRLLPSRASKLRVLFKSRPSYVESMITTAQVELDKATLSRPIQPSQLILTSRLTQPSRPTPLSPSPSPSVPLPPIDLSVACGGGAC